MLSIGQVGEVCLLERLEVVEERLHHALVEVVVRKKFFHSHENGVAVFSRKES
jgi:hypothetical protein